MLNFQMKPRRFVLAALAILASSGFATGLLAEDANAIPTLGMKPSYPNLKFNRPLWLEESPDGTKRHFELEQDGHIFILPADRDGKEKKTFFDISARKPFEKDEEGLLGMAFHPKFKENHKFYVFYTQQDPKRNILSEFQVSATDPDKADLTTERILLTIEKPYWNHNGGCVVFGPDGYLYLSVGDSGDGRDPHNFGQSLNVLYGKILRLDVDHRSGSRQYAIPTDNPFPAAAPRGPQTWSWGVRPEIWAFGLRNVWRMSFDRKTGELYAADVGQDKFEEVDIITKGGNYGWSVSESFHPFKDTPALGDLIDPIIEYGHSPNDAKASKFPDHGLGQSITGGFVYRGKKLPGLYGVYVYADYMTGTVFGLRTENGKLVSHGTIVKANAARRIASFGEDLDGEIFVLPFDGKIYDLVEPVK